ncbi:cell division protein ZapA [Lachnospiraceae bacterium oral taxon 500]|nr:cell division protein ZapA [Lachnospiraceae bacterium oral taxon 500]
MPILMPDVFLTNKEIAMENQTKVLIGGQVYTLNGNESEEYMQRVALYLNKKMDELKSGADLKRMNSKMQSILLAINIVDDLFKERKNVEEEKKRVLALTNENKRLHREIEKTKQELEEYLKVLNAE